MAELTKNDLKEVFTESLEPFAKAVQEDFKGVNQRLDNLEKGVRWIKDNASELFAKLDEFITLFKKQEQELTILATQVKRLEDRVVKLESQQKP